MSSEINFKPEGIYKITVNTRGSPISSLVTEITGSEGVIFTRTHEVSRWAQRSSMQ